MPRGMLEALQSRYGTPATPPVESVPTRGEEAAAAPQAPRASWWDAAGSYMVATLRAGQYATAKELNAVLLGQAGQDGSPFDRGEGRHRGVLFVRELGQPLALKTIQNNWKKLRTAASSS